MHASLPSFFPLPGGVSRPLLYCAAALATLATLAFAVPLASAQAAPRPWLDWRTVETEHFVFHFPERYRVWTMSVASRMEGIRSQVERVVGFVPDQRVDIVVDDPENAANGTAYTPLDAPTIVLWANPPSPREEIGSFRVWGELIATHEFAHVAHLTRPSRNRVRNVIWRLSPVPLGPIASESPRWVIEGYATYVEGRVTGTGRPNHAWRAAMLRQFAIEGRLPGYGQLNGGGSWDSGNYAYLVGSAFFEWLARREGDSSVTALWRRMTAKADRPFDEAFSGVYGGSPAQLYGRFAAELTADALAFERALNRDGLVTGTLVQHLTRNTGDPAISPDGRFVALLIRHQDSPSQLVVWKTADEPDTVSARVREQQLRRDPQDVPDRAFYPAAKRVIISLISNDGAAFETPRWLPDNKHLLLTRRVPSSDGTLRPDLFLWSAEDGTLSRITTEASVREADPSADGRWAAAARCDQGWCDLVRVDLATGALRVLIAGNVTRNFYRPRVSRTTGEIVVAEQSGDRWRIARVNPDDGTIRYADPDDGVTRYDATWEADGHAIVATSEADGVANLERLDADPARATRLTAVTGAAVAPDVAPDGTIWFLSLHAGGYDLRRIRPDRASSARASHAPASLHAALVDSLSPVLPPRNLPSAADSSRRPGFENPGGETEYDAGPTRFRYVPMASSGYGGSTTQLSLVRSDPIGRLGMSLLGSVGAGSLPTGMALEVRSRTTRTTLVGNAWLSHEAPSRQFADAYTAGLDLTRFGGAARLERLSVSDGGELLRTAAFVAEEQYPSALSATTRFAGIAGFSIVRRQRDEDSRYEEQISTLAEAGRTGGGTYLRQRSSLYFGAGSYPTPLTTVRVSYGTIGGGDGSPRERYVIGGFSSPLLDPGLDARRVDAPAYPVGSSVAFTFASYRVSAPIPPVEIFYSGASPDFFKTAFRSYGVELRERIGAIPALGTPDVAILTGFARAVDEPVTREWRYYVTMSLRP